MSENTGNAMNSRESVPALQLADRELNDARERAFRAREAWRAAEQDLTTLEAAQTEAQQASTLASAAVAARAYLDATHAASLQAPTIGVHPRPLGE